MERIDNHERCVVHIDIDCFYAQVEQLKRPQLRDVPFGVRQKNLVVTANYEARRRGVPKYGPVEEALKICPELQLVNGEDLADYRAASNKIFSLLQSFKCPVEKLGLDENYADVTSAVEERLADGRTEHAPVGQVWGSGGDEPECACGCRQRLAIASHIAADMRRRIRETLSLTSSAGIAHNKLLAKLVSGAHKPNDQTVLFADSVPALMQSLPSLRSIPSIGEKTAETLASHGINSISDLQMTSVDDLKKYFSSDMAVRLSKLSHGIDDVSVKMSTKPASIGLEDSFTLRLQSEVEDKFSALLARLTGLVRDDGRIPLSIRVTLRKKDSKRLGGHRESRQCQISPTIFSVIDGIVTLTDSGRDKLMTIIMRLFNKLVDLTKPFHLTLVGLAFTKFRERASGRGSIVNYLMNDLSVQSVLSLQNDCDTSVSSMDISVSSPSGSTTTDHSESEMEPSPKKMKRVNWIAKRRCLSREVASPSKLRVGELRLNSRELEKVSELRLNSRDSLTSLDSPTSEMATDPGSSRDEDCPRYVDQEVFNALPEEMQQELKVMWKNSAGSSISPTSGIPNAKPNTILRYFIPNK